MACTAHRVNSDPASLSVLVIMVLVVCQQLRLLLLERFSNLVLQSTRFWNPSVIVLSFYFLSPTIDALALVPCVSMFDILDWTPPI